MVLEYDLWETFEIIGRKEDVGVISLILNV